MRRGGVRGDLDIELSRQSRQDHPAHYERQIRGRDPNSRSSLTESLVLTQIQEFCSLDKSISKWRLTFTDARLQKVFDSNVQYGKGPLHWVTSLLLGLFIALFVFPVPRYELTLLSLSNFFQNLSFTIYICIVLTLHFPIIIYKWATHDFEAKGRVLVDVLSEQLEKGLASIKKASDTGTGAAAAPEARGLTKRATADKSDQSEDQNIESFEALPLDEIRRELAKYSKSYQTENDTAEGKPINLMQETLASFLSGPKTYEYANHISQFTQIFIIIVSQICILMEFAAYVFQSQPCPAESVGFTVNNYDEFIGCFPVTMNTERVVHFLPYFFPIFALMGLNVNMRVGSVVLLLSYFLNVLLYFVEAYIANRHSFIEISASVLGPLAINALTCLMLHQYIYRNLDLFIGDCYKASYVQLACTALIDPHRLGDPAQHRREDVSFRGYEYFNQRKSPFPKFDNYNPHAYENNQELARHTLTNANYAGIPNINNISFNAFSQTNPNRNTNNYPSGMNLGPHNMGNNEYRPIPLNNYDGMYIYSPPPEPELGDTGLHFEHRNGHGHGGGDLGMGRQLPQPPVIQTLSESALQYHTMLLSGQYGGVPPPLHQFMYTGENQQRGSGTIQNINYGDNTHPVGTREEPKQNLNSQQNNSSDIIGAETAGNTGVGLAQQQPLLTASPGNAPKTNDAISNGVMNLASSATPVRINHTRSRSHVSSESSIDHTADESHAESFAYSYNYEYGNKKKAGKSEEGLGQDLEEGSKATTQ